LEGLGEEVADHVVRAAVTDREPTLVDLVGDVEIADVEVAGALA
jgi:hypothetical protein